MTLLMQAKAQIYENTQLLYHEESRLSLDSNGAVSDPVDHVPKSSNGTRILSDLGSRIVYQRDAPADLKLVSWASGVPFDEVKSYAYNSESRGETVIYVIEKGIDGRNRVIIIEPAGRYASAINANRNSSGRLQVGSTPLASKEQRQTMIRPLTDLAWPQRPQAPETGFQKLLALWLSSPLSALST